MRRAIDTELNIVYYLLYRRSTNNEYVDRVEYFFLGSKQIHLIMIILLFIIAN